MSSSQTTQQRRRARAADTEEGFDTLANILTNTFYHQYGIRSKKGAPPPSSSSNTNNGGAAAVSPAPGASVDSSAKMAFRSLSTSFSGSLNHAKTPNKSNGLSNTPADNNTDNNTAIATPSTVSTTGTNASTINTRATRSSTASVTASDPSPNILTADMDYLFDDGPTVSVSSLNRGMRRLKYPDIVRMAKGQEFTLVVPHLDRKQYEDAIILRQEVLNELRRIVVKAGGWGMNLEQKKALWESELAKHTFDREGKDHFEFNVRIANYAERSDLKIKGIEYGIIHELINNNRGIVLELVGYGSAVTFRLKYKALPYIEVFRQRESDEPFLDPTIECPKSCKDETLIKHMVKEFHMAKGDPVRYVEILMRCYQRAYKNEKMRNRKATKNKADTNVDGKNEMERMQVELKSELNNDALVKFATMVDNEYYRAMQAVSRDWTYPCTTLIPDSLTTKFYNEMKRLFPLLHFAFATMISSRYYTVPVCDFGQDVADDDLDEDELHRKERMILFAFFVLLRTKSKYLLRYWSQVEPMGYYANGCQQPGKSSFSGSFTTTLRTVWKHQLRMYEEGIQEFNDMLQDEVTCRGTFDNHNESFIKKDQTEGKSALMHIGTAALLGKDRPYELPSGTTMMSPSGIQFVVTECIEMDEYKYIIHGIVSSDVFIDTEESRREKNLIEDVGFIWPKLQWKVRHVPGFPERPEFKYEGTVVPAPRRAWVTADASNMDIVSNHRRGLMEPEAPGAVPFDAERYIRMHQLSRRLVDMRFHAKRLVKSQKDAKTAKDNYDDNMDWTGDEPELICYNGNTTSFIDCIEKASVELDAAAKFAREIVKHINPKAGLKDKMFAFPIMPFCETSHEGMKMVYAKMGELFQMFELTIRCRHI